MAAKRGVFSKSAPAEREKPTTSEADEKRRKSMFAGVFGSKKQASLRRLSDDAPPPEMTSVKASKLLGVKPPPQAKEVDDISSSQRPMEEKYKTRRKSTLLRPSVVQMESYRTSAKNKLPMGYMQIRKANMNSSFTSIHDNDEDENALSSILLEGLKKLHLCDVAMIGKDGVTVRAPKFLLCSHSRVIEDMILSDKTTVAASPDLDGSGWSGSDTHDHFEDAQDTIIEGEEAYLDSDGTLTIRVSFAAQGAILTALHFMASHELPTERTLDSSEENIRTLTQVHTFAKFYRIEMLEHEVYRTLKILVNKTGRLASAVFDECSKSMKLAGNEDKFKRNELKAFVFDSIREKPEEYLIVGGLKYLSPESMEKIICDQEIDVDEITMFHILFTWIREGPGEREDRLKVAKSLVSNIQLTLMDVKYLNTRVRHSGFVDASAVDDAIQKIEDHLANLSPEEQEHVLVSGAGTEAVNGIYVRMEEDIGLGGEEAVFIKEASEDEIGGDYGLYLWKDQWSISPCVDYSNVLYCRHAQDKRGWNRLKPSADKWATESGKKPAPTCEWSAGANESKANAKYEAPRLSTMKKEHSIRDIADGDYANEREMSLDDMMNLPTDEDFEGDDYRGVRPKLMRSSRDLRRMLSDKK